MECDYCKKEGEKMFDPFVLEIFDKKIECVLCPSCEYERMMDI
jgi:hypothetical protein